MDRVGQIDTIKAARDDLASRLFSKSISCMIFVHFAAYIICRQIAACAPWMYTTFNGNTGIAGVTFAIRVPNQALNKK